MEFYRRMNTKYLAVIAAVALMLVAATALATTGNAFATDKSQAAAQTNDCGNGELPENVFCSNTASQMRMKVHWYLSKVLEVTEAVVLPADQLRT